MWWYFYAPSNMHRTKNRTQTRTDVRKAIDKSERLFYYCSCKRETASARDWHPYNAPAVLNQGSYNKTDCYTTLLFYIFYSTLSITWQLLVILFSIIFFIITVRKAIQKQSKLNIENYFLIFTK